MTTLYLGALALSFLVGFIGGSRMGIKWVAIIAGSNIIIYTIALAAFGLLPFQAIPDHLENKLTAVSSKSVSLSNDVRFMRRDGTITISEYQTLKRRHPQLHQ